MIHQVFVSAASRDFPEQIDGAEIGGQGETQTRGERRDIEPKRQPGRRSAQIGLCFSECGNKLLQIITAPPIYDVSVQGDPRGTMAAPATPSTRMKSTPALPSARRRSPRFATGFSRPGA
jgi:hypothetical protein